MKNMKRTLLAVCLLLPMTISAQVLDNVVHPTIQEVNDERSLPTKPQAYIQLGLGMGMYLGENSKETDPILGYLTEVGVNIPFKNPVYGFQPAIRFVQKGAKVPYDYGDKPNTTIRQQYVEVPLYFTVSYAGKEQSLFRIGLGPYVAYGVGGKTSYHSYKVSTFGTDGFDMRRFDVGLGMDFVCQIRSWRFGLGMEYGFIPGFGKDSYGNRWPTNGLIYLAAGIVL